MANRPGRTVKLSVSIDQDDFELLKQRAKQVSGGNISAAITDMIRIAREWEGRERLATWLGDGRDEPTAEVMSSVRAEWQGTPATRQKKKRMKAA